MSKRRQMGRRWSFVGGRMLFEPTFAGDDRLPRDPSPGGARVAFSGSTPSRDNLRGAALRALAFAGNHLLFPLVVVLLLLYLFRDAPAVRAASSTRSTAGWASTN